MDLDESVYDYLEKDTEIAVTGNGEGGEVKSSKEEKEGGRSKRRNEEDGHRSEHRSKRSRGGEEEERDRDRSDRDRSRHRRHEREKDRENNKDRSRRSEETEKSREGEKDREKDRDRSRGKRDDKERDRDKRRDRDGEKSSERRDNEFRKKSREKREESTPAEAEPDPERDQRTVFAWQICLKADEKHVYDFFSKAGKVRDVRLIMDRNSRRSKGVGYIEFYDAMSVPLAIQMSGQQLLGQPVMVKSSEAEKNLAHSGTSGSAAGYSNGVYAGGARRLYVGNLHVNITEDQLRQVFEPFGGIELVQLPVDPETGLCKGYGFVQYAKLDDARSAQQSLNGILELAGRAIKVSAVTDQQTGQDIASTQNDLDDDEGGGLALNARSRALLMQKLDRSGGVAVPPPVTAPVYNNSSMIANPLLMPNGYVLPPEEMIGAPSECVLLKNMFDPETETDPEFDVDIKNDVEEECSKFGQLKHISIDKHSCGHVYVRFGAAIHAVAAQQALHKRWFAGKVIQATFMSVAAYEAKFPSSKSFKS